MCGLIQQKEKINGVFMNIEEKESVYSNIKMENLGLWNIWPKASEKDNTTFLNLYTHNGKLFFSFIDEKDRHKYVLMGRVEFLKEIWEPEYVRDAIGLFYCDSCFSEHPPEGKRIKKLKLHEIVDLAKRVETQQIPSYKGDDEGQAMWWLYNTVRGLICENYGEDLYKYLKKYSLNDFLKKDKTYGDDLIKRCYLNPFSFEEGYLEAIQKSREKRWKIWSAR